MVAQEFTVFELQKQPHRILTIYSTDPSQPVGLSFEAMCHSHIRSATVF